VLRVFPRAYRDSGFRAHARTRILPRIEWAFWITSAGNFPACDITILSDSAEVELDEKLNQHRTAPREISNLETAVSNNRFRERETEGGRERGRLRLQFKSTPRGSCRFYILLCTSDARRPCETSGSRAYVDDGSIACIWYGRVYMIHPSPSSASLSLSLSLSAGSPVGAIFAEACKISGRPCRHAWYTEGT